ncbi:MAG TPA: helix-turn-helix domain-containing protein [Actinophytocola sp.]|jgi:transcriptional regulator with XRE-family HTH domain|nr:helix-turn-helix domain-containing protein [Actinophytocola sp.]
MAGDPDIAAVLGLLRQARERRGWTAGDLGGRLDVTARVVEEWESGAQELGYVQYLQVCAALGLDPAEVVAEAVRRR